MARWRSWTWQWCQHIRLCRKIWWIFVANWLKCLKLMEVKVVVKCRIRTQSDESLQIKLYNFSEFSMCNCNCFVIFCFWTTFSKLTLLQEVQGYQDSFQVFWLLHFQSEETCGPMQAEGEDGQLSPHVVPRRHVETYNILQSVWVGSSQKILLYSTFYLSVFLYPFFSAGNTSGHYVVMRFNFGPSDATLPENRDIDSLRWNRL